MFVFVCLCVRLCVRLHVHVHVHVRAPCGTHAGRLRSKGHACRCGDGGDVVFVQVCALGGALSGEQYTDVHEGSPRRACSARVSQWLWATADTNCRCCCYRLDRWWRRYRCWLPTPSYIMI